MPRVAVQGPGSGKRGLSRAIASLAAVQSGLPSLVCGAGVEGRGRQLAASAMGVPSESVGGGDPALHVLLREVICPQMVGGSHTGIPNPVSSGRGQG